jgi:dihydroxy-acid dehydratase
MESNAQGTRAMLEAVGLSENDLTRPLVGVATNWIEAMRCNLGQRELLITSRPFIHQAGGRPIESGAIAISKAVAMGTKE